MWGEERMKNRIVKKENLKEFILTQKQAFPNLNLELQKKYFNLRLKDKQILILEDNGEYVGHLCFGRYDLIPPFQNGIFLEEFALKKEFRGKGAGKLLMKEIEKYCKKNKLKMIYLGTENSKKNKLIDYYKKLGYQVVGKLDDINPASEYDHGQVIMAKVIK
jgi:ribosomal protein S18 acetylase RimI-like enzyme